VTDLTPDQIALRAQHAKTFLGSDAWTELVERIEQEGFRRFKSKDSTTADREAAWIQLQAFEEVHRVLRAIRDRYQEPA